MNNEQPFLIDENGNRIRHCLRDFDAEAERNAEYDRNMQAAEKFNRFNREFSRSRRSGSSLVFNPLFWVGAMIFFAVLEVLLKR